MWTLAAGDREPMTRRGMISALTPPLLFYLVTRAAMLALPPFASDTHIYAGYAERVAGGERAYRDFAVEYPPLALVLFRLPLLWSGASYRDAFAVEMLLFDALGLAVIGWMVVRERRGVLPLLAYMLFGLLLQPLIFDRFDLAVGTAVLIAVVLGRGGGVARAGSWLALAAGVLIKFTPALLAPVLLAGARPGVTWRRRLLECAAAFLMPIALVTVVNPDAMLGPLRYHAERGVQIESLWSSVALVGHWFGADVTVRHEFGAEHLHGVLVDALLPIATAVMVLVVGLVMIRECRRRPLDLFTASAAVLTALLATAKVLSPQFFLWLVPVVPLAMRDQPRARRALWLLFTLTLVLTSCLYRVSSWRLVALQPQGIILLLARNVLLVSIVPVMRSAVRARES